MPEAKCKNHNLVVVEYAIGHDPETQVLGQMIALKAFCFECGMVQQVPAKVFEPKLEFEATKSN
jgi:hypothetical protein